MMLEHPDDYWKCARWVSKLAPPAVLHASQESRAEGLRFHKLTFEHRDWPAQIYVNPHADRVHFEYFSSDRSSRLMPASLRESLMGCIEKLSLRFLGFHVGDYEAKSHPECFNYNGSVQEMALRRGPWSLARIYARERKGGRVATLVDGSIPRIYASGKGPWLLTWREHERNYLSTLNPNINVNATSTDSQQRLEVRLMKWVFFVNLVLLCYHIRLYVMEDSSWRLRSEVISWQSSFYLLTHWDRVLQQGAYVLQYKSNYQTSYFSTVYQLHRSFFHCPSRGL